MLGIGAAWNEEEARGLGLFFPPTGVAIMWFVPDRRVERYLAARESSSA